MTQREESRLLNAYLRGLDEKAGRPKVEGTHQRKAKNERKQQARITSAKRVKRWRRAHKGRQRFFDRTRKRAIVLGISTDEARQAATVTEKRRAGIVVMAKA